MVGSVDSVFQSPFDKMRHSTRYGIYYTVGTSQTINEDNSNTENAGSIPQDNTNTDLKSFSPINQEIIDTVVQPKKNKEQRVKAGILVGASAFTLAGLTYVLSRGKIVKFGSNIINNLNRKITQKIQKLDKKESLSTLQSVYYSSLQNIDTISQKLRGTVLNYTPIKDSLFSKFLKEKLKLKKPCDAITNAFRKISFGTVKSNYNKSSRYMSEFSDAIVDINSRILSGEIKTTGISPAELVNNIETHTSKMMSTYNSNFTELPIKRRSTGLINKLNGLDNKVYNGVYGDLKGFIKDTDYWTKFIPEELIKEDKQQFLHNLISQKRIITNNPQDNYKELQGIITQLSKTINPENRNSILMLKQLKSLAKSYAGLSGAQETISRQEIIKQINSIIKTAKDDINIQPGQTVNNLKINELLNKFGTIVNADKKGEIEELLTIYKQVLSPDQYQKIKEIALKTAKSIDKSVKKEGFDYVDKLRDFAVGSALTDVAFSLGVPVVASTAAISTADTKEKKRSIALKYAIPIFVGIGISTLCTVKLISGGKALLAAAISSICANQLGEFIDDKLSAKTNLINNTISKTTKKDDDF